MSMGSLYTYIHLSAPPAFRYVHGLPLRLPISMGSLYVYLYLWAPYMFTCIYGLPLRLPISMGYFSMAVVATPAPCWFIFASMSA